MILWISIIVNLAFLALIIWMFSIIFRQNRQISRLVGDAENDSLEFYLAEIKKRGFDFTLKPKKKK